MSLALDIPALLAALLTAMIACLMGHFLFLRQGLLYANAVSHAVLPGIVAAAVVSHTLSPSMILLCATLAAMLSLLWSEWLEKHTILNTQGAMGMTLTSFFALGVVLLERLQLSHFHIDVEHALYGNLEGIMMPSLANGVAWSDVWFVPYEIWMLALVLVLVAAIVLPLRKELMVVIFDPIYADSIGMATARWRYVLAGLTAIAAAACFQATGAVVTIALFAIPVTTAAVLGGDAITQLIMAMLIAVTSVLLGYVVALYVPLVVLTEGRTFNGGGSIATAAGLILLATVIAKKHRKNLIIKK